MKVTLHQHSVAGSECVA